MNIHPIFVHFPIALITLYAIMEILQFRKLRDLAPWQIVKSVFLIIGTIGSFAALQTGEMAENIIGRSSLVEMHGMMATATVWVVAVLSVIYIAWMINTQFPRAKDWLWNAKYIRVAWEYVSRISDWVTGQAWLLVIVGIAVLALISITGALGGAIVYGATADPFVAFIYNLFF